MAFNPILARSRTQVVAASYLRERGERPARVNGHRSRQGHARSRGRTWLNLWGEDKQTAIYDPASDHWQVFENFRKALEAQDGQHDAELNVNANIYQLSRFGPGGRICYLGGAFLSEYFDGHQWRSWNESQIKGQQQGSYGGPPFFNRAGRASVNIGKHTMEYVDDVGWRVAEDEPGFATWGQFGRGGNRTPPPDFPLPFRPEQSALDN